MQNNKPKPKFVEHNTIASSASFLRYDVTSSAVAIGSNGGTEVERGGGSSGGFVNLAVKSTFCLQFWGHLNFICNFGSFLENLGFLFLGGGGDTKSYGVEDFPVASSIMI